MGICGSLFCHAVVAWTNEQWELRARQAAITRAVLADAAVSGRDQMSYTEDGRFRPLLPTLSPFDHYALALFPQ